MALNKQNGNMYGFVTHTKNYIKGKCEHDCKYCYMHDIWDRTNTELRFDGKELKENMGSGKFIFVGSSTDMFAQNVPTKWQVDALNHCCGYDNDYLFQTKNSRGMLFHIFPIKSILCTTIETNRNYKTSNAPNVEDRIMCLVDNSLSQYPKMITVEPIMDFDLLELLQLIKQVNPIQVNIGADSCGHGLPEPSKAKIMELINGLKDFTKVYEKTNLKRLLK